MSNATALLVNISKYGAASVIGVYLAYQMGSQLPVFQKDIGVVKQDIQRIDAKIDSLNFQISAIHQGSQDTQKLLRSICLILAQSQQDKQLCNL